MKKNVIVRAGIEDGIGFITGFPLTGTAGAIMTEVILPWIKGRGTPKFLDWELKAWPHIYSEVQNLLEIKVNSENYRIPQQVIFDNTVKQIPVDGVCIEKVPNRYALDTAIKVRTNKAFGLYLKMLVNMKRKYHNDLNLRLTAMSEDDNKLSLSVQDVFYEDYIRTNLVLDYEYGEGGSTLRKLIHADKILDPLNSTPLANNFGVNILIFTIDGKLIIQKRSKNVVVRPNEYCPSASGTISSLDIPRSKVKLSEVPLMREAVEELGFPNYDVSNTYLLGITRELIRGGEPELFLAAKSGYSFDQLVLAHQHADDKFESHSISFFDFDKYACDERLDSYDKIAHFINLVDKFIAQYKSHMSIPLWTAIALWKKARLQNVNIY